MRIARTNLSGIASRSARRLGGLEAERGATLRRLAGGLRVSRGRDDPAALIASESTRAAQTRAAEVADSAGRARQAARTLDAAVAKSIDNLHELRYLASAAFTSVLSREERDAIQMQTDLLIEDTDRLLGNVEFKDKKLFEPPPVETPPDPRVLGLTGVNIGNPFPSGSSLDTTTPGGLTAWEITSGGSSFGPYDDFHFVRKAHTGDGVLEAEVHDITSPGQPFAKNGLAWRASDSGTGPFVFIYRFENGDVLMHHRPFNVSPSLFIASTGPGIGDPTYTNLRLARVGNEFIGSYSLDDGDNWTEVGRVTIPGMPVTANFGLATNSNNYAAVTVGKFSSVRFNAGLVPPSDIPDPDPPVYPDPEAGTLPGDPPEVDHVSLVFNLASEIREGLVSLRVSRLAADLIGDGVYKVQDMHSGQPLELLNPEHGDEATRALDAGLKQLATLRSRFASFEDRVIDPLDRASDVAETELAAAGSQLRDADFAAEAADLARTDLLRASVGDVLRTTADQQRLALTLVRDATLGR